MNSTPKYNAKQGRQVETTCILSEETTYSKYNGSEKEMSNLNGRALKQETIYYTQETEDHLLLLRHTFEKKNKKMRKHN